MTQSTGCIFTRARIHFCMISLSIYRSCPTRRLCENEWEMFTLTLRNYFVWVIPITFLPHRLNESNHLWMLRHLALFYINLSSFSTLRRAIITISVQLNRRAFCYSELFIVFFWSRFQCAQKATFQWWKKKLQIELWPFSRLRKQWAFFSGSLYWNGSEHNGTGVIAPCRLYSLCCFLFPSSAFMAHAFQ